MIADAPGRSNPGERGFILVAVLWILAALATLASVYAVYADNAAFAIHINDDRLRIRASVLSGIELTAYQLTSAAKDAAPPRGGFVLRLARSRVEVSFVAEGARVDLNAATKEMLAGLFEAVGAKPDNASDYADRVIGWRKKGVVAGQNDEAALYKNAGYAYAPRQAPFRNALELPLVLGIPPGIVERALPHLTIFNGQAQIDIRVAEPLVLSALPKVGPDQVKQILARRDQTAPDDKSLLQWLGPASAGATIKTTPACRIRVDVALDDGRTAKAEVVILVLEGEDQPFRVLSWRDDVDGSL